MSRFLIPVLLYLRRLRSRGRPKQLKFDFCPYRTLPFATTYRSQAKDDVSLPRGRRRWQKHKKEAEETVGRAQISREGGEKETDSGENKEEEEEKERSNKERREGEVPTERTLVEEEGYVRGRECLGRPLQSGDDGARSVYIIEILRDLREP